MNSKKICFIMCANDEELANECLLYISQIKVPEDFEVETLVVRDAVSMCAGYNEAMRASDAKYKIYLHQDVLLIYKEILVKIVDLFVKHPEIGMIGMVGSKSLADDGCQWSDGLYRRVGELLADTVSDTTYSMFGKPEGDYQQVLVLDGLFMATQYDVPWREDLFGGWDFYDSSQSLEFWKAGYQVVVPYMNKPWCLHDNDVPNLGNYERWRSIFEREYKDIYRNWSYGEIKAEKLVSVIIPTYNRAHTIKRAIDSVLNQTYGNIELIIVDDCSTDGTCELVKEWYGDDKRITYIMNNVNTGAGGARNIGVDAARGSWIAFHDSDDEWCLDKLEKQMALAGEADSRVGMIYSQIKWHYDNGETSVWPDDELDMKYKSGDVFSHVLISPLCGAPAMVIRKECFEDVGGFDESLRSLEDYEFTIRFAKKYAVLLCNEPLVNVYESINSVGKQSDEKIKVQCMIMKKFRDDFARFGYRKLKMKAVWNEAEVYGNLHVLENSVKMIADDEVYMGTFRHLSESKYECC